MVRNGQGVMLDVVGKWWGWRRDRGWLHGMGARVARDKSHRGGDVGDELTVRRGGGVGSGHAVG